VVEGVARGGTADDNFRTCSRLIRFPSVATAGYPHCHSSSQSIGPSTTKTSEGPRTRSCPYNGLGAPASVRYLAEGAGRAGHGAPHQVDRTAVPHLRDDQPAPVPLPPAGVNQPQVGRQFLGPPAEGQVALQPPGGKPQAELLYRISVQPTAGRVAVPEADRPCLSRRPGALELPDLCRSGRFWRGRYLYATDGHDPGRHAD